MGFEIYNLLSTIGVFVIIAGTLAFTFNLLRSIKHGAPAPMDPWQGATLEWAIPSPPPEYNFAKLPTVYSLDPMWHQEGAKGHKLDVNGDGHGIHMPNPSFWPVVTAFGMTLMMSGLIYGFVFGIPGFILFIVGVFSWALEPAG
jgi:cytochrome c oxidase subunit 1